VITRNRVRSDTRRTMAFSQRCVGWQTITVWLSLWLWLVIAGQPELAMAQVPQENSDTPAVSDLPDITLPLATDPDLKKNAVWLALMMWGGIIFGGVILLTLVVMWGNRTRRLARSPLPPVAKRDELWFLKPKPPAGEAGETGPSDSGSSAG
jgi:hypothetical protein